MKTTIQRLSVLLISLVASVATFAYDACVDGIYYKLNSTDKTAEVTFKDRNYNSYSDSVNIPETVTYDGVTYSVTIIGTCAFAECYNLTSVTIPNSVTSIKYGAFNYCTGLTSITIPNSVTIIDKVAFERCTSLTSVTIGNSVTDINNGAFLHCSSLTSIIIPNSVTFIGSSAFEYCSSLKSVTFPHSIADIEFDAFAECMNIENVYCYAENVPYTQDGNFGDSCIQHATLYVPAASIDAYKATEPWSNFGTIKALGIEGDVNGDGMVDNSDVNSIISVICGTTSSPNADVNSDGTVDISDVNKVISVICGGEE